MKKQMTVFYALFLALTLILSGCGDKGSTGAPGAQGEPGTPGTPGGTGPTGSSGTTGGTVTDPFQVANFHGFINSSLAKITATPTTLTSPNLGKPIVNGPNNPANPCVTITSTSINATGNLEVNFEVKKTVGADRVCGTADDGTYTGSILDATIGGSALTPNFIFAQLRPGDGSKDPSYWVNYVNGQLTKVVGYGDTAEGTSANQPSSESHTNANAARKGTLLDNNDQTYKYTTKAVVTAPIVIPATTMATTPKDAFTPPLKSGTFNYNNNVIRVGIQMSGVNTATAYRPGAANNAIFDLVPAGAPVTSRAIVDVQTCNDGCHTTLALHGGGRLDTRLCVMCHNATAGEPHSGNVLDLKVMVHKIHMGKYLPSVKFDFAGELAGNYGNNGNAQTPLVEPLLEDSNGQLTVANPAGPIKGKPYRIWGRLVSGVPAGPVDFTEVGFPANPANCQKCHKNLPLADVNNWKGVPSKEACGACHDGIDFSNAANGSAGSGDRLWFPSSKVTPWAASTNGHLGGPQADNSTCTNCHQSSGTQTVVDDPNNAPIPAMHGDFAEATAGPLGWSKAKYNVIIDTLELSPPLAPGEFYDTVNGVTPTVTIRLRNVNADGTPGALIDPATMTSATYTVANLFVSGPRALRKPVLTTAAAVHKQFPDSLSTAGNNLRTNSTDPRITRTADSIVYQLSSTKGLAPGTYVVFLQAAKTLSMTVDTDKSVAIKLITFQVGTATPEKKIAFGCPDCHDSTAWHDLTRQSAVGNHPAKFDPDYCGNCHDYDNTQIAKYGVNVDGTIDTWRGGKTNTISANSLSATNLGFGAAPIARRIHGVHNGGTLRKTGTKMLNFPLENYANHDITITFPQDVRNCEKCHPDGTTSGTWKTKPNRVACLACHDSTSAGAHAQTNTFDPTPLAYTPVAFAGYTQFYPGVQYPNGPFSGDEAEACATCHSANP